MAKKNVPESFVIDEKKKTITIYTNVVPTDTEKYLIEVYLKNGYSPRLAEKPKKEGVAEMEEALSKYDEKNNTDYKSVFSGIYRPATKGGDDYKYCYPVGKNAEKKSGFFGAIAFYNAWKKADTKAKKEAVKAKVREVGQEEEAEEAKVEE